MPLESRPEAPQDQSQNPAADLPRAQETLSQVSEPVAPGPYSTGPLDEGAVSDDSHAQAGTHYKTLPLQDVDAPPVPPLDDRSVVGDRYRVVMRLGSGRGSNFYRVSDGQGYRQCWACGSTASLEGDT